MSYPLPNSALDDRLARLRGNDRQDIQCLRRDARVVIPDPLGVWWGLALNADGKRPSVFRERDNLIVFGGPRGDLPLNEYAGTLIGESVSGMAESCIIDLSEIGTRAGERRFMLAF